MAPAAALMTAIASLLWPIIAAVVLWIFGRTFMEVLGSARSRKFTLKIGGQELSMDEASEQQRSLISDLQSKVVQLEGRMLAAFPKGLEIRESEPTRPIVQILSRVLWVDDEPKNNSYFVDTLNRLQVVVDLAENTADGLVKFNVGQYSAIISDMGRREGGRYNRRAGLELLKLVRERNQTIPFFIFCSGRSAHENREEAIRSGANGITASATELYALLNLPPVE